MSTATIIADVRRRATHRTKVPVALCVAALVADLFIGPQLAIAPDTVNLAAAVLGGFGSYILVAPALASFQAHQQRLTDSLQRARNQLSPEPAGDAAPGEEGLMGDADGLVDAHAETDQRVDLLEAEVVELIETVTVDDVTLSYYVDGLLLVSASFAVLGVSAAANILL